jgi:hypothetical protein
MTNLARKWRGHKYNLGHECWPRIFTRMSEGEALTSAIKTEAITYSVALRTIRTIPELREMYEQALEDRADKLAEEILSLADEDMPEGLKGAEAAAWVNKKRLQVDARKWIAAKLKPKRYGDRLEMEVTDNRISITDALNEAKARVLTPLVVDVASREVSRDE